MTARISPIRNLSQREKLALGLLRGCSRDADGDTSDAFAALALETRHARYSIGAPDAPCVTNDERLLIGWLTILQRQRIDDHIWNGWPIDRSLSAALRRCASVLNEAGCRLDFRNAHRALPVLPKRGEAPAIANPQQARVLHFIAENGTTPRRDLAAFGASPTMLRTMCKRRLLKRVAHGLYGLGQFGARSAEISAADSQALAFA